MRLASAATLLAIGLLGACGESGLVSDAGGCADARCSDAFTDGPAPDHGAAMDVADSTSYDGSRVDSQLSEVGTSDTATLDAAVPSVGDYYVAPDGRPENRGTIDSPWDRASVFAESNPKGLRPGDVIQFRGGRYDGAARVYGAGSASAPLTFENYPGEVAIMDSSSFERLPGELSPSAHLTLAPTSRFLRFRTNPAGGHFVIQNTNPQRMFTIENVTPDTPTFCYPSCRPTGLQDLGDDNQIVNVEFADVGLGIASQASACGSQYIGNIFRFIGWESPRNAYGEAFYVQNEDPATCPSRKRLSHNVAFGGLANSFQIYGSSGSFIRNIDATDNVIFDNGPASMHGAGGALLIGGIGSADVRDDEISRNTFFTTVTPFPRHDALRFYVNPCVACRVESNYVRTFASGSGDALTLPFELPMLIESGNRFVGPVEDSNAARQFPRSTFVSAESSDTVREHVDPIDATRRVVVLFDGDGSGSVAWTPRDCAPGTTLELRDMLHYDQVAPDSTITCSVAAIDIAIEAPSGPYLVPVGTISGSPLRHPAGEGVLALLARQR